MVSEAKEIIKFYWWSPAWARAEVTAARIHARDENLYSSSSSSLTKVVRQLKSITEAPHDTLESQTAHSAFITHQGPC